MFPRKLPFSTLISVHRFLIPVTKPPRAGEDVTTVTQLDQGEALRHFQQQVCGRTEVRLKLILTFRIIQDRNNSYQAVMWRCNQRKSLRYNDLRRIWSQAHHFYKVYLSLPYSFCVVRRSRVESAWLVSHRRGDSSDMPVIRLREDHKFKSDKPVAKAVQSPSSPKRGTVPVKSVDSLGKPVIRVWIDQNPWVINLSDRQSRGPSNTRGETLFLLRCVDWYNTLFWKDITLVTIVAIWSEWSKVHETLTMIWSQINHRSITWSLYMCLLSPTFGSLCLDTEDTITIKAQWWNEYRQEFRWEDARQKWRALWHSLLQPIG